MSVIKTLSNDGKTLTLNVQGPFDFSVVYDFRVSYTELDKKPEVVIVDFKNTIHLDSSALGMLLNLKRYMESNDKEISIINIRNDIKKILKIAHFEKIFNIT